MFCQNCGKQLHDEAVICPACGVATGRLIPIKDAGYTQEKNGIAIAGFVCSFFMPLLGWIFGGIGLARANKRNGKEKGLSIAAIVIASVLFVLGLAIL